MVTSRWPLIGAGDSSERSSPGPLIGGTCSRERCPRGWVAKPLPGRARSVGPARAHAHTHAHAHKHKHEQITNQAGLRTKPRVRGPALQRGRRSAAACSPKKPALRTAMACALGAASGSRRRKGAASGVAALNRRRFGAAAPKRRCCFRCGGAEEAPLRAGGGAALGDAALRRGAGGGRAPAQVRPGACVRACVLAYFYRIDEVLMWRCSCGMPVQ